MLPLANCLLTLFYSPFFSLPLSHTYVGTTKKAKSMSSDDDSSSDDDRMTNTDLVLCVATGGTSIAAKAVRNYVERKVGSYAGAAAGEAVSYAMRAAAP